MIFSSSHVCLVLLHSLWQMALLAGVVGLVGRLWRGQSVESRYALHVAALVLGVAMLPITYAQIPFPAQAIVATTEATSPTVALPASSALEQEALPNALMTKGITTPSNETPSTAGTVLQQVRPADWACFAPWLVGIYAMGVVLMLARLLSGIMQSQRLGSGAKPITEGPLHETLQKLSQQWSLRAVPALAYAEKVVVPKVLGLIQPTILLPTSALTGLTASELEMILAHELAHVRRHDMGVYLFQRLAEAVLFFNPTLWYLSRRISTLREYCCDEMTCRAIAETASDDPKLHYATALLRVVELAGPKGATRNDLAALAASGRSPSELRRRVARLLGEPLREPVRLSRGGILILAVMGLILAGGPMLWPTQAQTTKDETSPSETPRFSFGGQIEVLAIGTHGEKPQRWWDADGALLQSVPFHVQGGRVNGDENLLRREIVFRVHDLPKGAHVVREVPNSTASASGHVVMDGQKSPPGYYSHVFIARVKKTLKLRVGVASGEWVTVTDGTGSSSMGLANGKNIAFSNAMGGDRGAAVVVTYNYLDAQVQVKAIDKSGKSHRARGGSSTHRVGSSCQAEYYYDGLQPEQIERFEFLTRDIEWVEMEGIPVDPQEQTTIPPDTPATISGKIVLADGSPATTTGWLHYDSRKNRSSFGGTVDEFVDRFSCEVPSGKVWLWYFAEGFAPAIVGPYDLASGENKEVTITLDAGYRVPLRVVDAEGNPVPEARISASPVVEGNSMGSPSSGRMVFDDLGNYLLENVADVEYSIRVEAPGFEQLYIASQKMHPNKVPTLRMIQSQPASGIVFNTDGSPAAFAKLFLKRTVVEINAHHSRSLYGASPYGDLAATTDAEGRFALNQLARGAYYVFVIEAADEARLVVYDIKAGLQDIRIAVPKRRDLYVKITGGHSEQGKFHGSPTAYISQSIEFNTKHDSSFSFPLKRNTPIELTGIGGTAIYRGLPVDPTTKGSKQQVNVSINADVEGKIVDLKPEGVTHVEFVLPDAKSTDR